MNKTFRALLVSLFILGVLAQTASAAETFKSRTVSLTGGVLYPTADSATGKTFLVSPTGGIFEQNSVTILGNTNKILANIPLAGVPYYGTFAINPENKEFYVTMFKPTGATTIYAISTQTNTIVRELALGSEASNMTYDVDKKEMNILVKEDGVWHLVSLNTNDEVTSDTTIAPTYTIEMMYDPNNKSVDIVDGIAQKIYIVDSNTRNVTTLSVPNIGSPFFNSIVYNPSNKYMYVLGQHNTITVLNGNIIAGTITIPIGNVNLNRLGYSPANNEIYVTDTYFGGYIFGIKDLSIVGSAITLTTNPTNIAYNPDDKNIYVVDYTASNVTVISPDDKILKVITLSPNINPESIVYNPVVKSFHIPVTGKGNNVPSYDLVLHPVI